MTRIASAHAIARTRTIGARTLTLSGAALAAALLLSGCTSAPAQDAAAKHTTQEAAAEQGGHSAFSIEGGWVKAQEGMTGVFGTLKNSGKTDLTLVSVESPAAKMVELHETVTSGATATMREVEGGFVIPAGGSFELAPGGNHIMFMDMPKPILPGDDVALTLRFDDGSTAEVTVLAKATEGAQENYEGGSKDTTEGEMDHGDMDHGDAASDEHAAH
ncbi:copper chaperone PCu(A)C [Leucobacter sp. PH1c]|uniref:copper chaperone PCu(A)C n=1 Tax=Leucobacter sp. PH1c TaxID=1397278 RepID=UPI00046A3CE1|nr:copper chaperone PCu(A)C [Leucobacter sp. PH1c]